MSLDVEQAVVLAHDDWGRIIALLAARDGDIAGVEDSVADAVKRALHIWPAKGIPQNPSGWIYRTALNLRRDVWNSAAHRTTVELDAETHETPEPSVNEGIDELPDRRLQLLAACAHPDIDPATRPLLMLSAVLKLPTRRIAEGMTLRPRQWPRGSPERRRKSPAMVYRCTCQTDPNCTPAFQRSTRPSSGYSPSSGPMQQRICVKAWLGRPSTSPNWFPPSAPMTESLTASPRSSTCQWHG